MKMRLPGYCGDLSPFILFVAVIFECMSVCGYAHDCRSPPRSEASDPLELELSELLSLLLGAGAQMLQKQYMLVADEPSLQQTPPCTPVFCIKDKHICM